MRHKLFFNCIMMTFILLGCQSAVQSNNSSQVFTPGVSGIKTPWTDLDFLNNSDEFQFAIISDLHGGNRSGIFEKAVEKINLMQPEFVLSVGDLIEGYTDDEAVIDRQRTEFERLIEPLEMRFFFVPGNHDLTSKLLTEKWESLYGRTYYHFIYRNALFLCLNTEDPSTMHISEEQIEYVRHVLSENGAVRWTFVFMHQPLWLQKNRGWEPIEEMLSERPHTVFAGHEHNYVKYERNSSKYIKLATTGGVSSLRGANIGEFDQIVWVTMNDQGPIIANLSIDGIFDENLVTEEKSKVIGSLFSGDWLTSDSIILETETFDSESGMLHINNPWVFPLSVKGSFKSHSRLQSSKQNIDLTIAPGTTEDIPVDIYSDQPVRLSALEPLVFSASAAYAVSDQPPIVADIFHQLDIRYVWQEPELIINGGFDQGMEGWTTAQKSPASGTFSIESDALKVHVEVEDSLYSLALAKVMNVFATNVDYQLSFKAKSLDGPNQMRMAIRDGSTNAQLLVDGKIIQRYTFQLTETMTPYHLIFRPTKESNIIGGILLLTFFNEKDILIDDISLRRISKEKMP